MPGVEAAVLEELPAKKTWRGRFGAEVRPAGPSEPGVVEVTVVLRDYWQPEKAVRDGADAVLSGRVRAAVEYEARGAPLVKVREVDVGRLGDVGITPDALRDEGAVFIMDYLYQFGPAFEW